MSDVITARGLAKRFGEVHALRGADLALHAGVMRSLAFLAPQLAALLLMTGGFLVVARLLARRWKAV